MIFDIIPNNFRNFNDIFIVCPVYLNKDGRRAVKSGFYILIFKFVDDPGNLSEPDHRPIFACNQGEILEFPARV